jgi:hypothetical protein
MHSPPAIAAAGEFSAGSPRPTFAKRKSAGRAERRNALAQVFDVDAILREAKHELRVEDVLDALVSCWSAMRLATGKGRCLVTDEITIWV